MTLDPLVESDAEALASLFASIGMSSGEVAGATGFIRHVNSDKAIGRKLVVAGEFVAGGQLTRQRYPHVLELGFWVHASHQRRGYGLAVARGLVQLAFGMGAHRVFAKTGATNVASWRLMDRLGMRREGVLRDAAEKDGAFVDELWYGVLATEWKPAS